MEKDNRNSLLAWKRKWNEYLEQKKQMKWKWGNNKIKQVINMKENKINNIITYSVNRLTLSIKIQKLSDWS